MRKHIITLCGLPGSGKSSTADKVAQALGYERFSGGDFMREVGRRRGLSIDQTNVAAIEEPSFDQEVDDAIRSAGERENLVIDSRTAFYFIPGSFKVFLKLDPRIAAERTFEQIKNEGRIAQDGGSLEEVYRKLLVRIHNERTRYKTKYGFDYLNETQFDLV